MHIGGGFVIMEVSISTIINETTFKKDLETYNITMGFVSMINDVLINSSWETRETDYDVYKTFIDIMKQISTQSILTLRFRNITDKLYTDVCNMLLDDKADFEDTIKRLKESELLEVLEGRPCIVQIMEKELKCMDSMHIYTEKASLWDYYRRIDGYVCYIVDNNLRVWNDRICEIFKLVFDSTVKIRDVLFDYANNLNVTIPLY